MAEDTKPRFVRMPTDDEVREQFEAYTTAVGKVAFAWNYLQEKLGELFCTALGVNHFIASAIWYSSDNDRVQRGMLKALLASGGPQVWGGLPPAAREDAEWLMKRLDELAENRNDAVHAPCSLYTSVDETEMMASLISEHKRARRLTGKQLLVEFDWLERYAESFTRYVLAIEKSLASRGRRAWPERPQSPNRQPKKALLNQRRQPQTK